MSQLFTPFTLRGLTLDNRIVVPPLCQYSSDDGVASDWHAQHLPALAISGAGLVVVEMTDVEPIGRITPWCAGLWNDAQEAAMKRVLASCRKYGAAKIGIQIAHAGRKASCDVPWRGGKFLTAGEGRLADDRAFGDPFGENYGTPRAMVREDFERVLAAFVDATRRAARAGFDSCEMHGAHGYLLSSFFSPLSNRREDEYGGRDREPHALPAAGVPRDARGLAGGEAARACACPASIGSMAARPSRTRSSSPRRSRRRAAISFAARAAALSRWSRR